MYPSVAAAFPAFTERFEGHVPFMYLDVKGLVTTGRGNLIDPYGSSTSGLPWVHKVDGSPATSAEISAEWQAVKGRQDLRMRGGMVYASVTSLCLTNDAIDALTTAKAAEMENHLRARFSNWDTLPADAQLGVLSMSWACGPMFHFPAFEAHLATENFVGCMIECTLNETGNPGLKPRNAANRQLFVNAATAINAGLPRDLLTGA